MSVSIKKKTASLFTLNEKCLEKLFEYLEFPICLKLVEAFDFRHEIDTVLRNTLIKGKRCELNLMEGFEGFVQEYGPQLSAVSVDTNAEWINLLADFCVEGKLHSLELTRVSITDSGLITRSKTMLSEVVSLKIMYCEISDENLGRLLAMCPQLETMEISQPHNTFNPFLKIVSTNMKSILTIDHPIIDRSTLIQLLAKHPKLREFGYCDFPDSNIDII